MIAMLQAARARDRDGLQSAFAAYARGAFSMHALQLLAVYESWSGALNAIIDALDFGIDELSQQLDSNCAGQTTSTLETGRRGLLERALENAVADAARDAALLPVVRIGHMLVCSYFGAVAAHDQEHLDECADAANVFFVDARGEWVASSHSTHDVIRNPAQAARAVLLARKTFDRMNEQRPRSLEALARIACAQVDGATPEHEWLNPPTADEAVAQVDEAAGAERLAPKPHSAPCAQPAREAALRFLRARCELDARAHPQFRLIPRALERELDALLPDVGMTLALLLDGGAGDTVQEFERRYPVLAAELIFALRALLPLSCPRSAEAETRRLHAFLQALVDAVHEREDA